jgi:hypothetical protein
MRKRMLIVVGPAVIAGLTLGAAQIASGAPADSDARRPTAAPQHTDADLYGEAQGAYQAAAGGAYIQSEVAALLQRQAEAAAAYAGRRSGGGGGGGCGGALDCIKQCESHGDYGAVSSSGQYRGAYQFQQSTWESVGGSGDPAAAPPEEQDARAQILYDQRGAAPWGCG